MNDQQQKNNTSWLPPQGSAEIGISSMAAKSKPNDRAGLIFSGLVKIFDPHTKKVFVETRS